jgi:hypothetical protein
MSFTDDQLKGLFDPFGNVNYAGIVVDQMTVSSGAASLPALCLHELPMLVAPPALLIKPYSSTQT